MGNRPLLFVFSREYPPHSVGGTSTVARNLSTGMTALGWQVAVVTTNRKSHDEREQAGGVTVHRAGTGVVYNSDSGLADDTIAAHRRLHRAAVTLAGDLGRPAVITLPDLFCFPEAAAFARAQGTPLVNILLQDFQTLTRYDHDRHRVTNGVAADPAHLFALEEKALNGSDHICFISHALSDAITGYYPSLRPSHEVIHLGVDEAEIATARAATAERARLHATLPRAAAGLPLVVACGRLVPVKGFDSLLRALALLGPVGATAHLALLGIGPEEPRLRTLAAELGIGGQVTFLGDRPRPEVMAWMSMATVAVVPSRWESFCYVCAEMMAFGRPVVATAVDSLNELMPTDEYGYRVAVTQQAGRREIAPAALAQAIGAALADPGEAARRGAAARQRILTQFTKGSYAAAMSRLCADLGQVTLHG
jgi:glycogen(starch) synthase